jgi:hypothetical protein
MRARGDVWLDMSEPTLEELQERDFGRLDIAPVADAGDQSRTFDLRLPLGAFEAVPLPAALPGGGVALIKDDCPMSG